MIVVTIARAAPQPPGAKASFVRQTVIGCLLITIFTQPGLEEQKWAGTRIENK
jgi:hypothetical protein